MQERLREEVERARRYELPLSLLVADLDHFKSINDAFGHTRGDLVLIGFVERVRGLIRDSDLLFRYGGDEFVLLLMHTDRQQARVLAGRLLDGIRSGPFPGNPLLSVTLSIGSASFPDDGQSPEDLFECADRRLYEAKRHGRDRVIIDDPLSPVAMTFDVGTRVMERELPLTTLRQFFDQLPDRQHGALSISGPSGSGKTWFLAEAVKMARLRGYAAWALEGRPALRTRVYGAVAEAKPLAPGLPPLAAGKRGFLRAVQAYLQDEAKAGLILAVDNLAELDRDTHDVVRELLFSADIPVAGLIYTLNPANAYQSALLEAPLQVQVELRPLTAVGVRLWLRNVLRWEAPEDFCQWLHAQTDGLPGQLQSGLTYLIQHEILTPLEAGWSIARPYATIELRGELSKLLQPPPTNLPLVGLGFVGRDEELQALKQRLGTDPLVTIVGPGGIGKTRLALQAAAETAYRFHDGVFLISLASVVGRDVLISTTAQVLGWSLVGPDEAREQLLNHLAACEMLLVLDDFSYELGAAELLLAIQQRAPKVRLLVTSRDRLDLPGSSVIELRGLPIPPAVIQTGRGGALPASHYSAEQMFLLVAQRAAGEFALTDEDRLYVRRICQLVDGMPLGIELAAAWTPLFTCREIAQQIERNVDFLTTARAHIPERQRSTRAVLDYFWGLLGEDERRRLRALSVFQSGFEREAAQQVAEASLFFLSALVDKAFLRRLPSGRYEMHELLRQYAELSQAERPDEQTQAGDRHCRYYAEFLDRCRTELKGPRQAKALGAINAEIGNIRAAWQWAVTHRQVLAIAQSFESLVLFYDTQNWFNEGADTFGRALDYWRAQPTPAGESAPDPTLARLLIGHGVFTHRLGLNVAATESLQHGLSLLDQLPPEAVRYDLPLAHYYFGLVRLDMGEYEQACDLFRQSLERRRGGGDTFGMGLALSELAGVAFHLGRYTEARELYQESLALQRSIDDYHGQAVSLSAISELALELGDIGQAQSLLQLSAEASRELDKNASRPPGLRNQGWLADVQGNYAAARQHYGASLEFSRSHGNPKEIASDLLGLGEVALHSGQGAEAQRYFRESLGLSRQSSYRRGLVRALVGLGDAVTLTTTTQTAEADAYPFYQEALQTALAIKAVPWVLSAAVGIAACQASSGRPVQAVELLTLVVYHPACNHRTHARAASLLSRLEAELPAAEVAEAEERGRRRQLDEAVRSVVETVPTPEA